MSRIVAAALVVAGFAGGCSVFASKAEYADYRQVRMAQDEREELVAMYEYVSAHPHGVWTKQIQAERQRREPAIWQEVSASEEGLEFYLRAYPDAPHAAEARPRLAALQQVDERRQTEAERAEEVEQQRREALAERRRTWLTRASEFWTQTLLGISNWGAPIPQVARQNPAFSRAFGMAPRPICSEQECLKFYRAHYAIPVPGATRIDRNLELWLRLRLDEDREVRRAELLLPNKGFSRWFEQENRTPIVDEDPQQRQEAIMWALERLVPAIREVAPNAESIDVVPEPIDPPSIRLVENEPAAEEAADEGDAEGEGDEPAEGEATEEAAETDEADTPAPETAEEDAEAGEGEEAQGELASLLEQAAGSADDPLDLPGQEPNEEQRVEMAPAMDAESLVLPIALQAFRAGNVRIVVFAAADDDEGPAYDGLFIEQVAEDPEEGGAEE